MKLGNEGKITIGHRKLQNIEVVTILYPSTTTALTFAFGAVLLLVLLVKAKAREEGWKLKRAESTFLSFFGIC